MRPTWPAVALGEPDIRRPGPRLRPSGPGLGGREGKFGDRALGRDAADLGGPPFSVNHRLPSPPTVMPIRSALSGVGTANSSNRPVPSAWSRPILPGCRSRTPEMPIGREGQDIGPAAGARDRVLAERGHGSSSYTVGARPTFTRRALRATASPLPLRRARPRLSATRKPEGGRHGRTHCPAPRK